MIKTYNKLVRNNIPMTIEESGKEVKYHRMTKGEYQEQLRLKLIEEVNEFVIAPTKKEMVNEMADILTVLEAIQTEFKIDSFEVSMEKIFKDRVNGTFTQKYCLESVEEKDSK